MDYLNTSKEKKIKTDTLVIEKNTIKFQHITIHIQNISQLEVGQQKIQIPYLYLGIATLIGLAFLSFLPIIGILIIAGVILYAYMKYKAYADAGQYLTFILNSGTQYSILVKDNEFLDEMRTVIESSMNGGIEHYTINIDDKVINGNNITNTNGAIVGQQIVTGNHSDVVNPSMGNITFEWNNINKELTTAEQKMAIDSSEYTAIHELKKASEAQNSSKFANTLQKFKDVFTSDFVTQTFSSTLSSIILHLLHLN